MTKLALPSLGGVLYTAVVCAIIVGLAMVASGPWRTGVTVCGGALVAAGVGRAVIPERMAGLLRVRRRSSDVVVMAALGATLVVLAVIVPDQP